MEDPGRHDRRVPSPGVRQSAREDGGEGQRSTGEVTMAAWGTAKGAGARRATERPGDDEGRGGRAGDYDAWGGIAR
jgi:hypothetical protein